MHNFWNFSLILFFSLVIQAHPSIKQLKVTDDALSAITQQQKITKKRSSNFKKMIRHLLGDIQDDYQIDLSQYKFERLPGSNKKGRIRFTAYFTPVVDVKSKRDDEYKYAFYQKPPAGYLVDGKYPTRKEIDADGVLEGEGLELAWTKNPLDIFWLQVQGSGFVRFEDGSEHLLAFDGKNGHPHISIGKQLSNDGHLDKNRLSINAIEKWFQDNPEQVDDYLHQNPSFAFFRRQKGLPRGACGVELTAMHSVAVDPKIIPYGSVILARIPPHGWQLLLAQDKGAAVTGPGRIDWYVGVGEEAKKEARHTHQIGEAWLLTGLASGCQAK